MAALAAVILELMLLMDTFARLVALVVANPVPVVMALTLAARLTTALFNVARLLDWVAALLNRVVILVVAEPKLASIVAIRLLA